MLRPCGVRHVSLGVLLVALATSTSMGALRHAYTFNDGTANDSIGTAHGLLMGGAAIVGGQAALSGNNQYIDLPAMGAGNAGININTYADATFEGWFTYTSTAAWQRLFDFGDTNEAGQGRNYIFYTPRSGGGDNRAAISNVDPGFNGEDSVQGATNLTTSVEHHVAVVVDASGAGTMSLYVDGVLSPGAQNPVTLTRTLSAVSPVFAYLGRSTYADPYLTGNLNEFRIYDNALSAPEVAASFAAGPAASGGGPKLTINRDTGAITLANTGAAIKIFQYTITAPHGSLNTANVQEISMRLDAVANGGNGSFDNNDAWEVLSSTSTLLSEEDTIGQGGEDGGTLGTVVLSSNGGWIKSFYEDIQVSLQISDGAGGLIPFSPPIEYVGNGGQAVKRSDLNLDNTITGADWNVFKANHLSAISPTMTAAQTSVLGDLNGDLKVNAQDFRVFKADFIAANGAAAWNALGAPVPEPSTLVLALFGGLFAVQARRGRGWRSTCQS